MKAFSCRGFTAFEPLFPNRSITSDPDQVTKWHEFCRDRGNLSTIAVIHSTLDTCEEFTQSQPYLEMTCGAWLMGQPRAVPDELLKRVRSLFLRRSI